VRPHIQHDVARTDREVLLVDVVDDHLLDCGGVPVEFGPQVHDISVRKGGAIHMNNLSSDHSEEPRFKEEPDDRR
jgi:hypothetical protein